jgi:hypothetical protein
MHVLSGVDSGDSGPSDGRRIDCAAARLSVPPRGAGPGVLLEAMEPELS